MKKVFALALAAALLLGCRIGVHADPDHLVKVLMTTPGATVTSDWTCKPDMEALDDAVEASDGIIPEDVKFAAGRLTVMEAGTVDCDEEVYDVSFKIWSTVNRAIGLFFCAEEDDTWELISCNLGDVIEGRFQSPGTYVIAVGW